MKPWDHLSWTLFVKDHFDAQRHLWQDFVDSDACYTAFQNWLRSLDPKRLADEFEWWERCR